MRFKELWNSRVWGLGSALAALVVVGCSSNGSNNNTVVAPEALTTENISVSGRIAVASDAGSSGPSSLARSLHAGASVANARVTVKGDHASKVVNGAGNAATQFTTDESGLVSFHLRNVVAADFL